MKMRLSLLLIISVFASEEKEKEILVKIEDGYTKTNFPEYIGVTFHKRDSMWCAQRWGKNEHKIFYNGTYKDKETAAHASDTLARKLMANGENGHKLNFPDDDIEVYPEKTSDYIGLSYNKKDQMWRTQRWSRNETKYVHNGYYKDEDTAARASDTLAKKLMANGEKGHKLNFPDDDIEVHPERKSSEFIGVSRHGQNPMWRAQRYSKNEHQTVYNGSYKDEETAAHASDTLAKKFMANGENGHKLNFLDDDTEVYPEEKKITYFGVNYNQRQEKWRAGRWSKNEQKTVYNGTYKDEETAARASDTLARKLIANGEKGHKINFPDEDTENKTNKRKRPNDFQTSQPYGISLDKFESEEFENNE